MIFIMKVVENSFKTHEIAPFKKFFLGGACPQPPPSNGSQLRCSRHAAYGMYSQIQKNLKLDPPSEKSCIRSWSFTSETYEIALFKKK